MPMPKTLGIEGGIGMNTRLGEDSSRMQTCTKRSIGDTDRWDVGLDGKFSIVAEVFDGTCKDAVS